MAQLGLGGSRATPALAGRLRRLREQSWPGRRVTQATVAKALAVSVPTISSYENAAGTISDDRLASYATFFATERSVASAAPRLLGLEELTPTELETREDLLTELRRLQEPTEPTAPESTAKVPVRTGRTWQFGDGAPIRLVCGSIPEEERSTLASATELNHTELLAYADLDALVELFGHLRAENPHSDVRFRRSEEVVPDDLSSHIVIIGGLGWNEATEWISLQEDFPVAQVNHPDFGSGEIFEVEIDGQRQMFFPKTSPDPSLGLLEDVGLLMRIRNPYNRERTLTFCNGVYSRGVLGAVRCLTDAHLRDRNENYISKRFGGSVDFGLLMRVRVFKGKTVTPELTNASTPLYEWPERT